MTFIFLGVLSLTFILIIFLTMGQLKAENNHSIQRTKRAKFSILISILLAFMSATIYLQLGSFSQLHYQKSPDQKLRIEFTKVLANIANNINQNPNNPYYWYMLSDGNFKLNKIKLAKNYITRAFLLDKEDAKKDYGEILLLYSKVLATEKGDFKDPFVFNLLKQANETLEKQALNYKDLNEHQKSQIERLLVEAKWLLGFAYFNNLALDEAIEVWQDLEGENLTTNQSDIISEAIVQVKVYKQNRFELNLVTDIDEGLMKDISANATLFITLRGENNSRPIAAKRIINLTFPNESAINQDDLLMITQGEIIKRNQKFILQAFISQNGVANITKGDLVSDFFTIDSLDAINYPIPLMINRKTF